MRESYGILYIQLLPGTPISSAWNFSDRPKSMSWSRFFCLKSLGYVGLVDVVMERERERKRGAHNEGDICRAVRWISRAWKLAMWTPHNSAQHWRNEANRFRVLSLQQPTNFCSVFFPSKRERKKEKKKTNPEKRKKRPTTRVVDTGRLNLYINIRNVLWCLIIELLWWFFFCLVVVF